MSHPLRDDRPGRIYHVINRGLSRRTVFENRADIRFFLSRLARCVRQGRIEVIAYSFLATHFHLVLRSLDGNISETMRLVENAYVRRFNRPRKRDGSLFRSRFLAIPVESLAYLQVLIRYIDQNAVEAHLVSDPVDYPYGSARYLSRPTRRPLWLSRTVTDVFLTTQLELGVGHEDAYRRMFPLEMTDSLRKFVERRSNHRTKGEDSLDDLVGAAPERVLAWMRAKAKLADGTAPGIPIVTAESIDAVIAPQRLRSLEAKLRLGPRTERSLWDMATAGLLRDTASETFGAIAKRLGTTEPEARRRVLEHRASVQRDSGYADIVSETLQRVLSRDFGESPARVRLDRLRLVGRN